MRNSIYKIKYLLFLSWDWEAWCLTQTVGVIPPPPERNTAWNKGRKCFHCLGAPNNLIRPWRTEVCSGSNLGSKNELLTHLSPTRASWLHNAVYRSKFLYWLLVIVIWVQRLNLWLTHFSYKGLIPMLYSTQEVTLSAITHLRALTCLSISWVTFQ